MSPTSTDRITLTGSQRRELTRMTRAGRTEQRLVTRAQIVLAAAAGESNAQIARWLRICEDTVRKWRRRWCAAPGAGVVGRCEAIGSPTGVQPRSGRPGQGDGLHAPQGLRATVVALVVPGAGPADHRRRNLRVDLAGDGTPVAVAGRAQTVAVPVVDLHLRSRLRRQSPTGTRPVRPRVGRETVGPQRLCDLGR